MYTVNCPWHVFHIVYVGSFWVEHLKEKETFYLVSGMKKMYFLDLRKHKIFSLYTRRIQNFGAGESEGTLWPVPMGFKSKAFTIWALFRPKLFCYAISGFFYWNSFSVFRWQQACMPKFTIFFSANGIASVEFCGFPEDFHPLFAEKIFVYRYLIFQYSH